MTTTKLWTVGNLNGFYPGETDTEALSRALIDGGYAPGTAEYDEQMDDDRWEVLEAKPRHIAEALRCGTVILEEIEDDDVITFGRVTSDGEYKGALVVCWDDMARIAVDTNGNPIWGDDGATDTGERIAELDDAYDDNDNLVVLTWSPINLSNGLAV